MSSNKQKLFEALEEQRGVFFKIAFIYFFAVIIGLGLIAALQATLEGIVILAIVLVFVFTVTAVFLVISRFLYKPIEEIDRQVEKLLKTILNEGLPEEEEK